jgi:hypothetical protein
MKGVYMKDRETSINQQQGFCKKSFFEEAIRAYAEG